MSINNSYPTLQNVWCDKLSRAYIKLDNKELFTITYF